MKRLYLTNASFYMMLLRITLLSIGGVAALQWLHGAIQGRADVTASTVIEQAAIVLPLLILSMLWVARRSEAAARSTLGIMYAAVMGGTILLSGMKGGHDEHAAATGAFSVLGHALLIMMAAWVFAYFVDQVLDTVAALFTSDATRQPSGRAYARFAIPVVAALALGPALVITDGSKAIAQTTFPDQVIHPQGNLNLIARKLSDGSMAYIAPDFGANGVRPTIEMTEGETLNITLKNELTSAVSLHVHGVHYNQDSDGTKHNNSFAAPGATKVFQWRAAPGTSGYWHYHDHVLGDDEGSGGILGGLYGALIVRKPGDPKPAKTFVIVGHDKTLNGRIYPDTPTYSARQGQLVEWVVVSHGNRVHTFHLHGHRWLTPNRPADPNSAAPSAAGSGHEDNHILAPGDSFGFLSIAGEGVGTGMWMYHCHFQDHASAMKGFFQVLPAGPSAQQNATSRTFPETGKTVSGRFLEYWNQNGGLAQQGFPLSEPFQEKSELDGKTYLVQYFERSVFEMHPENPRPHDVLLSQLGTFRYKQKYPNGQK